MVENSIIFCFSKMLHIFKFNVSKNSEFAKFGLSDVREFWILFFVSLSLPKKLTQMKISKVMAINKNIVGILLDNLESQKLIKRQKNEQNRKENFIVITAEGEDKMEQILKIMIDLEREMFACLSEEEFTTLKILASKVTNQYTNYNCSNH